MATDSSLQDDNAMRCQVCGDRIADDLIPLTFRCDHCGFFSSRLPILINSAERINEDARARALKPLRTDNYRQLLDETAGLLSDGAKLLDVGCAHGWFLQSAAARGIRGCGIEPDREMAARAQGAGLQVLTGFFPDDILPQQLFDVITFNDVFEHLPDINGTASALLKYLKPSGIVIINLPVSNGLIFRAARMAARIGVAGPLERMWQMGMPSPHISYFNQSTLTTVFERAGFKLVHRGELRSVETRGLYQRIRYDKEVTQTKAVCFYAAARALGLVSGAFRSDIQFFVFRII